MSKDYEHHANYYEIDQIGCVHHSNFVHWMKETRIDIMGRMGCGYCFMEEAGIMNPVPGISYQYRTMAHFDDHILTRVRIKAYNAIRVILSYEMRDKTTGKFRATGESSHYFLNREGHPVSLRWAHPTWDEAFQKATATQNI